MLAIAEHCHTLHDICIFYITGNGLKRILSSNRDLMEIVLQNSPEVTDESLQLIINNCPNLRKIHLTCMESITDQGIAALVSNNRDLNDILIWDCELLTNASLIAIAEYCHNLRRITLLSLPMTNEGFVALVSNNHDLEYMDISEGPLLTKDGIEAEGAQHKCHNITWRNGFIQYRRFYIEA